VPSLLGSLLNWWGKAYDSFLTNLKPLKEYFEQGYSDNPERNLSLTINSSQFIYSAAQVLATIIKGICSTFPFDNFS